MFKHVLVGQVHVFTYTGYDDASPLLLRFGHHDISHDARIVVVEVTDRFISQNEVERLTERTHHCHTLLVETAISKYTGIKLMVSYTIRNLTTGTVTATAASKHCFMKDEQIISLKREAPEMHEALMAGLNDCNTSV